MIKSGQGFRPESSLALRHSNLAKTSYDQILFVLHKSEDVKHMQIIKLLFNNFMISPPFSCGCTKCLLNMPKLIIFRQLHY